MLRRVGVPFEAQGPRFEQIRECGRSAEQKQHVCNGRGNVRGPRTDENGKCRPYAGPGVVDKMKEDRVEQISRFDPRDAEQKSHQKCEGDLLDVCVDHRKGEGGDQKRRLRAERTQGVKGKAAEEQFLSDRGEDRHDDEKSEKLSDRFRSIRRKRLGDRNADRFKQRGREADQLVARRDRSEKESEPREYIRTRPRDREGLPFFKQEQAHARKREKTQKYGVEELSEQEVDRIAAQTDARRLKRTKYRTRKGKNQMYGKAKNQNGKNGVEPIFLPTGLLQRASSLKKWENFRLNRKNT